MGLSWAGPGMLRCAGVQVLELVLADGWLLAVVRVLSTRTVVHFRGHQAGWARG